MRVSDLDTFYSDRGLLLPSLLAHMSDTPSVSPTSVSPMLNEGASVVDEAGEENVEYVPDGRAKEPLIRRLIVNWSFMA